LGQKKEQKEEPKKEAFHHAKHEEVKPAKTAEVPEDVLRKLLQEDAK
jgi:hypothetical protein